MHKHCQNLLVGILVCVTIFSCCAFTNATTHDTRELPIIMYHKIATKNPNKYVVTEQQLAQDCQAIIASGYTPVFMREVIAWVNGQGTLPAKPIVITFDDGQYNNLYYGLPIAQKYGIKYVINPVTAYSEKSIADHDTDNPRYSNLSWQAIKQGHDSGLVEFGNHTHDLHRTKGRYGVASKRNEDPTAYEQMLRDDITHAQDLLTACGIPTPTTFAYPFGKYTNQSRDILINLGFQALLTCNERVNTIRQGDPTCLYELGRFNRSGHYSTAQIMQKIQSQKKCLKPAPTRAIITLLLDCSSVG